MNGPAASREIPAASSLWGFPVGGGWRCLGGECKDWGWGKGPILLFWFVLLFPASSLCCLSLAALCFCVRVMICSGKHRAGVRSSFLEDGESSVLFTGGRERVRQTREASPGSTEDNFGLCGRAGRRWQAGETPQRQRQGTHRDVGAV